jgi:hypothetical protein
LRRWEKVTHTLIPKEPGAPKINRIRRIIIEADLNMSLSEIFGQHVMNNAEQHGLLHKAQYGSRKGKMAISAVLHACLMTLSVKPEWMHVSLIMMLLLAMTV